MASSGRAKVSVPKDTEIIVVALQANLVKLCEQYQIILRELNEVPQGQIPQRELMQEYLSKIQGEIRTLDRKLKEEIKRGTEAFIQFQGTSLLSIAGTSSSLLYGKKSAPKPIRDEISTHPTSQCKKEEFLDFLGLISQEALQLRKLNTGKVERRRRTANTNPKYSSNGFLKLDELSTRRSKRLEVCQVSEEPLDVKFTAPYIHPQPPLQSCYVCYGTEFNLSCETCTTKFHADCIKLTASNAPIPHRLPICPKCVQAANTSQIIRIQNWNSRPPPSIMRSTSKIAYQDECSQGPRKRTRRTNSTVERCRARGNQENSQKRTKKGSKPKFPPCTPRSDILDSVTNRLNEVNAPRKPKRKGSSKAKAENAIVIRKTIIAMTAAANTVMSNPMKCSSDAEDEWGNDSIMQSISSVIAWAGLEEYQGDQSYSQESDMPMLMSPSMVKCELQDEKNDDDEFNYDFEQQTAPDNLSVGEDADENEMQNDEESKSNLSCSMKGQISDEDDESETLLSLDSPAPSWADGEMSRTELVEKMLLVQEPIMEQTKLKSVACGTVTNS